MNVKRIPAEAFIEKAFCECGTELKATGEMLAMHPPHYVHWCEKCRSSQHFAVAYPRVVHEERKSK